MDEKQLQALFNEMKSKLELGDFATFKNQIGSDEKFRKAFYTEASNNLELGDFNAFEESFLFILSIFNNHINCECK